MKVLKIKDKRVAKRLTHRLLKKGMVVAQTESEEELKKDFSRKADVVIVLSEGITKALD